MRLKRAGAILFVITLIGAVVIALASISEAFEERRSAAAARDLQVTSMTVVSADLVRSLGGDVDAAEVASSIGELMGDHDVALHALSPEEAQRARRLLAEIAGEHLAHDHDELHGLLDLATYSAEADAAGAERQAALAVFGAVLMLGLGAWLLIRSRHQIDRERSRAEARAATGRRWESLIHDSPEIFLLIDRDGRIAYRSASADRLLDAGASARDDIVALAATPSQGALGEFLDCPDALGVPDIFLLTRTDGTTGSYQLRVADMTTDDLVDGHVVTARDVTDEVRLREELRQLANTDLLTGLPNRRVLQAALEEAKSVARSTGSMMGLMSFDIDGFKVVNDTLGHLAGDELLAGVATRLCQVTAADQALLRMGGDEFALIIPSLESVAAAETLAERLLAVLDEPVLLGDRSERVRTSIGVAVTADPGRAGRLLREADTALYEAKRQGGDSAVLYVPALDRFVNRTARITSALRGADHDSEFSLLYQPIVATDTGELVGLEALLRWTSPDLGSVTPTEFIPIAETSGEIRRIGSWVIDSVCRQLATWTERGIDPNINVSFNVSARQLDMDDFVSGLLAVAASWSISPERLVVEVTESTALERSGIAAARLEQLRQTGLQVSLDDFGSGYSNLGQLLRVPIDVIKVDRALLLMLSEMRIQAGDDPTGPCTIMEAIVSIAGILGAPVVVEGVETEDQLSSLKASGIRFVQGYLTGRPQSAEAITPLLCATALNSADASLLPEG